MKICLPNGKRISHLRCKILGGTKAPPYDVDSN